MFTCLDKNRVKHIVHILGEKGDANKRGGPPRPTKQKKWGEKLQCNLG